MGSDSGVIVHSGRIQPLNQQGFRKGDFVLYWMQQAQRAEYNPALEYGIELANALNQPLKVVFALTADYPEANLRHYWFMLQGLKDVQAGLKKRGIALAVVLGNPPDVALASGRRASVIVCDRGYLRHQKTWRRRIAAEALCRVVQVESDVIVPVDVVSTKSEYAARTIRPKIKKHLHVYLQPSRHLRLENDSLALKTSGQSLSNPQKLLSRLKLDRSVGPVAFFTGGTTAAKKHLRQFISGHLAHYDRNSSKPHTEDVSHLSPYLHFGQISPLHIALRVQATSKGSDPDKAAYLEQLIVRRELSMNFVNFNAAYDQFDVLPQWARHTLEAHAGDRRTRLYDLNALASAATHDPYWNAAMLEMKITGFMHNYMRMYWGKKILEWSPSPQIAFQNTLALNNKYFLDGRDPNSYVGVAWIYGLHDRAWKERPIFGKVRYMAASGLERKCDIRAYVEKIEKLARANLDNRAARNGVMQTKP